MGAERFAAETFQKAEKSLAQAEAYQARNAGRKPVTMTAREAVQMAEDSRAIAVKRQEEEALTAERQQSAEREARAESERVAAQSETDRVTREADAGADQSAGGVRTPDARKGRAGGVRSGGSGSGEARERRAHWRLPRAEADRLKAENGHAAAERT